MSQINKCQPHESRKNIEAANNFARNGIDFVPIPSLGESHKASLIQTMIDNLDSLEKSAISSECDQKKPLFDGIQSEFEAKVLSEKVGSGFVSIDEIRRYAVNKIAKASGLTRRDHASWCDFHDCLEEAVKSIYGKDIGPLTQSEIEDAK